MKYKNEADAIIKNAKKNMRPMLRSVYDYNSKFIFNKSEEKLLGKILFAMSVVDRKFFVSPLNKKSAYDDNALPISKGQTISQPSTVARMLLLADLQPRDSVLEIGAGSGWNAALISFLVYPGSIVSFDRIAELVEKADKNLKRLLNSLSRKRQGDFNKFSKLKFVARSIFDKNPELKENYDKIIFTAGIVSGGEKKIENMAKKMLKQKGILICPKTSGPMLIYKKRGKKIVKRETKEDYVFVPLLK